MRTKRGYELPRVLTPAVAQRIGISRSQTRSALGRGTWRPMAAGAILTRPEDPSRTDWAEAGVVLGGPSAALSGWDSLRLRGLSGPAPVDLPVLVLVRTGRSRRVGPVLIRRTEREYRPWLTSIESPVLPMTPLVDAHRAVADTALLLPVLNDVRALVAWSVQRQLCTPHGLGLELERCPRNGSGHLRRALDEVGAGARSAAEAAALRRLRASRLPDFELNVPVVDAAGQLRFVLDVFWPELGAALEIEGRAFHFTAAEWTRTLRRHNALTAAQLSLLHLPAAQVLSADLSWLDEIETWLRGRAREVGVPYRPGRRGRPLPSGQPRPLVIPAAA